MAFKRFVQVGRLCVVNYGAEVGKLCVIVDIVDASRVIVDGPTTGFERKVMSLKALSLTKVTADVSRGIRQKKLAAALEEQKVIEKFNESTWGQKKLAAAKRASLNDFDRFKVMLLKKERSVAIKKAMKQ
ncbi:putative 60S ribosomal protein L14 [Carpediemonas membranifera]|uniref:Putative 60S ribosomal protein L14 n=1 Tax=Carpediemonas membranifera TaxID=201153 RepID=A0A8J6B137_9EUKA|nr:putative 60S ribosomal protein L14 [Carpediemonas membranifera]|eukprot:KAG9397040.1 putative 60S ribosomal protein L14 [Carpediemonas membranifera]